MISSFNGKDFCGLSTDTKPTSQADMRTLGIGYPVLRNGSTFIEIDTGKLYFFDAANATWREWGA